MGESDYEEAGDCSKRGGFASVRRVKRLADGKVISQSNGDDVPALADDHEHEVSSRVDETETETVIIPGGRHESNHAGRVDETVPARVPLDLYALTSFYEPGIQSPDWIPPSSTHTHAPPGPAGQTQDQQSVTLSAQVLPAPTSFLFEKYVTRRPMTLAIRSSVETSFPTKETSYVVEDEEAIGFGDNRRIFKAERSGLSWFWNCALVDRDGNRLFTLERPSQPPKLLYGKETFFGRDAAKKEIFEIGCSKYPADHIKAYPEKLGPYMKAVCRFRNIRGGQESLAVDVFRWNKRDMYIKDEKTGRYIAVASMYFTGTGYIEGCRLLLEPGVDMVLAVAIGLVILRLNRC